MIDCDEFDMEDEESESWYASLIDTEKEIQSIVNLDPVRRNLKWVDGSELSFDESVERICIRHPAHSKNLIHQQLRGWLEQGELPEGLSEEELEKLDSLVSEWAEEIPSRLRASID